ncbi:MAG TPA: T9SS type A sorting domain-containing protein [Candidatus Kapabacteria bacterium]|nr:T9SS type A sorting domain-containing protein [Candidatus Kapabacteria bacterium]
MLLLKNIFIKVALLLFVISVARAEWVQTNGISGGVISSLVISGTNIFAGTQNGGVYLSTDNGANWNAIGGRNIIFYHLAISGGYMYGGTRHGMVVSTDNGINWSAANTGMADTNVTSLAVSDGNVFAGTGAGVFLSTDNGSHWNAVNSGMTNTTVYSLAVLGEDVFAGTFGGIFRSSDNGAHWTPVNTGLGADTIVLALGVSGGNLYASTVPGQFVSMDSGEHWNDISIPIPLNAPPQGAIEAFAFYGTGIFAGRFINGVYVSNDDGAHWAAMNTGLTDSNVLSLVISGGYLLAGTDGNGIWRRPLSEMTGVNEQAINAPVRSELAQNYPNPFTTSTHIIFPSAGMNVKRVSITDMLGKEVTVFPKESFSNIEWTPGASVPAGTYFLVVRTSTGVSSKPIVLLR